MKIGLFDHVEKADRPLGTLFNERLTFAAAAEEADFYCLHVAEHHASPLNMVPAPNVYLAAVARETRRIRLGPLVYLLPLYSPLRLLEEIAMVDHLSGGRLEIGIGRGVSPFEVGYHKIDPEKSRDIFIDSYRCIRAGMAGDTLDYEGPYHTYRNVPIVLRPLQQPHPPFWYGSSNTTGATWAGENGMHFVANGPVELAKTNIAAFKTALAKRGAPLSPKAEFPGGTVIGVSRYVIVADTDEAAERIARPALEAHLASLNWLRVRHNDTGLTSRAKIPTGHTYADLIREGAAIVGTPDKVVNEIARQTPELGVNYLLTYMFLGDMSLTDALRSLQLFKTEVMPRIASL
ncbi:MAG TPA: LLM class flavin-dependent oxidoreductase [Stellaceae bacterium]|nr:LLM class flavin-dependent oxidoreductase [Stellaceae bacterium]